MTWIKCHNEATSALYNEDIMDKRVEFNDNGTANVPEEVARAMVEHYELVEEYDSEEE